MKILFIQPTLTMGSRYGDLEQAGGIEPPFGICYLAAILRQNHFEISIIDAQALGIGIDETVEQVLDFNPDIVGITATTPAIFVANHLSKKIKEKLPNIIIIIGGCHISALPEETMQQCPFFDIGVIGEAEKSIVPLVKTIQEALFQKNQTSISQKLKHLKGIIFRNENGLLIKTDPCPRVTDLDDIPFPAFDLLPCLSEHYRVPTQSVDRYPAISLITSRGCVGRCTFCDLTITGRRPRAHSAEYTFELIRWVSSQFGIKSIMFEDDNFLMFHRRLRSLGEYFKTERLNVSWSCTARVDLVNQEILTLAKSLNCWQILYGLETGSQKILDFYKKNISIHRIRKTIHDTHRAKLRSKAFLMMGNPLETEETLNETIRLITSIPLNDISITFFTPYPGSPIYNTDLDEYGRFERNWSRMSSFDIVFIPNGLTKEDLIRYQKKAYRAFYLRVPVFYDYLNRIKNKRQLKELLASGLSLARYALLNTTR